MTYIFFAFLTAICFATSQILNKLLSKHHINNTASLFAYFLISTFSFNLFLFPFIEFTLPSAELLWIIAGMVSTFLVGTYFFYKGIPHADASTFSPLFQLQAALVGILAFIFLGERFPVSNYLWLLLIFSGALLVSFDEHLKFKSFLNKGIFFIFLMQLFHAVSNLFVGTALKTVNPLQLLFWENSIIGLVAVIYILFAKPKLNYGFKKVYPMFIISLVVGIGCMSLFRAFSENLTISSVIALLSSPIVFIFSIFASKFMPQLLESHTKKVYLIRGIGLLIILLGAYKIAAG